MNIYYLTLWFLLQVYLDPMDYEEERRRQIEKCQKKVADLGLVAMAKATFQKPPPGRKARKVCVLLLQVWISSYNLIFGME